MRRHVRFLACLATVLVALLVVTPASAQRGAANGQWRFYNGDIGSTKYSPLDQINKDNVSNLRIAWRRPSLDPSILEKVPDLRVGNSLRATPLMVDGFVRAVAGSVDGRVSGPEGARCSVRADLAGCVVGIAVTSVL